MSNHMPRDIVDILRYDAGSRPGGICEAAAKEIERLRADNAALRALLAECRPYIFAAVGGALGWKDSAFDKIANLLDRIDATLKERGEDRYWPYEQRTAGALPVPQLTEADVRRIVREELEKRK